DRFSERSNDLDELRATDWIYRFGDATKHLVETPSDLRAVERLPISLLRLPEKIVVDLRMLGFRTIGELSATPRAPLALRFGP
ncbi:hypothetical protein ACC693_38575, partial [Rhizobium ruizarguesonis]